VEGVARLSANPGPEDLACGDVGGLDPENPYHQRAGAMETCKQSSPSHMQQTDSVHPAVSGSKQDRCYITSAQSGPRGSGSGVGVVPSSSEEDKLPAKIIVEVEVEPHPLDLEPHLQGVEPQKEMRPSLLERVGSVTHEADTVLKVVGPDCDETPGSDVRDHGGSSPPDQESVQPISPEIEGLKEGPSIVEVQGVWPSPNKAEAESTAIIVAAKIMVVESSPEERGASSDNDLSGPKQEVVKVESSPEERGASSDNDLSGGPKQEVVKAESSCIEVGPGPQRAESIMMRIEPLLTEADSGKDVATVVSGDVLMWEVQLCIVYSYIHARYCTVSLTLVVALIFPSSQVSDSQDSFILSRPAAVSVSVTSHTTPLPPPPSPLPGGFVNHS